MDEKKDIHIKFIRFWPGFNEKDNFIVNILRKYFNVNFSDNPDYVFCSVFGQPYEEVKYDCVRIHLNGENYTPDFNLHDYAISYNELSFGDRYIRYPLYLMYDQVKLAEEKHLNITESLLFEKEYFCNYIYSDGKDREFRNQAFKVFGKYKKVASTGVGNNNMPNIPITDTIKKKLDFQKRSKFTIAFDSISEPGFVTEKILHAFASQTIPIYFGDPNINSQFNSKAFVNTADFNYDLEKTLQYIIEIDNDDNLYLSMLKEPAFITENFCDSMNTKLEAFLVNIFQQDYDKAFRRGRIAQPEIHKMRLKEYNWYKTTNPLKVLSKDLQRVLKSTYRKTIKIIK